jgi:hypothetical protein
LEQAIVALFDYFDANLQTLNTYLSDSTKEMVMTRVWKDILATIEGLLIPPLSESPSDMKPLTDKEVDIVFKWLKARSFSRTRFRKQFLTPPFVLQFLRDYFYAGGEGPVPLENLQNQKYRDVVSIRLYYDWDTYVIMHSVLSTRLTDGVTRDMLMEECVRMMQQTLTRVAVDQEARKERVFTTEPRDHQRSQAREKGREGSR